MTRSLRFAAWATFVGLSFSGCGQKAPLFLPKEEPPSVEAKAKQPKEPAKKPKVSPSPSPTPFAEPEAPSPADDAQDSYSPISDHPNF